MSRDVYHQEKVWPSRQELGLGERFFREMPTRAWVGLGFGSRKGFKMRLLPNTEVRRYHFDIDTQLGDLKLLISRTAFRRVKSDSLNPRKSTFDCRITICGLSEKAI